jgi:hypothetical protein
MFINKLIIILFFINLTACFNKNNQDNQIIHQASDNTYSYDRTAGVGKITSKANLSQPKYTKHRRAQRRFIHNIFK